MNCYTKSVNLICFLLVLQNDSCLWSFWLSGCWMVMTLLWNKDWMFKRLWLARVTQLSSFIEEMNCFAGCPPQSVFLLFFQMSCTELRKLKELEYDILHSEIHDWEGEVRWKEIPFRLGIIISLCVKRQSTEQQPRQPNARRAARPEIEFLCSHRLCETLSEFLRSCNVGPRTASNEPCWRRNGPVQF